MPLSDDDLQKLVDLANAVDGAKEKECTPFLEYAIDRLLPVSPVATVELRLEQRSPYGRSDFLIVADIKSPTGAVERFLYFWELKAPQCHLVEIDDSAERYRPTKDLIKAETQLLHYVHQATKDSDLKERWNVRYSSNIKAGGIIIGRDKAVARPKTGVDEGAAHHSFRIRQSEMYAKAGFQVITWDRVIDYLRGLIDPARS